MLGFMGVKLLSLLLLTLLQLKHASETCEWSFTRAEELRVASVNAGTDRDSSVQDLVFQAYRDAIACDPNDGDSWVRLVFLSPYEADRAVLPMALGILLAHELTALDHLPGGSGARG